MSPRWRLVLARLNPSCREIMRLFSKTLDARPGRADRIILAIHWLHCPACRRSKRQILVLVSMLRRLSGTAGDAVPGLPPAIKDRIKQAIRRE